WVYMSRGKRGTALEMFIVVMVVIAALIIVLRVWFFEPVKIEGNSMNDTLITGEKYFIYKTKNIKNGDIIVFTLNGNENEKYIKRVVAGDGDTMKIEQDELYINGDKRKEEYLSEQKKALDEGEVLTEDIEEMEIRKGEYYAMGDNRINSIDSREYGVITRKDILGKLIIKE